MSYEAKVGAALAALDDVRMILEQLEYALTYHTEHALELTKVNDKLELELDSCRRILRGLGHQSE